MTASRLIAILQTLPPDSIIQIETYDDAYEAPRCYAINRVGYREAFVVEKHPNASQPDRVVLS